VSDQNRSLRPGLRCWRSQAQDVNWGGEDSLHLISHSPTVFWSFVDTIPSVQDSLEIAVGTDNDWVYAEMWNPAPFHSQDTSVTYSGAPLQDGETYWLRLRVHNSILWSKWSEMSFQMNSIPTVPELMSPLNDSVLQTLFPELTIANSDDAQTDSLHYIFEISPDSFVTTIHEFDIPEDEGDYTTIITELSLEENSRYWWRVKASDYYEESAFSDPETFFLNEENTAPGNFDLILPPDTSGVAVETLTPTFTWASSSDPDPFDTVHYNLYVSIDSLFQFVHSVSGLDDTHYEYIDSLDWATRYWWRVIAYDLNGDSTCSNQVLSFRTVTLGDADGSGGVDIDDIVYLINYIFSSGLPPQPMFIGDANCSGEVDIDDVVYLIAYVFSGGPEPCDPNSA